MLSPVDRLKFQAILVQFDAPEDGVKLAAVCAATRFLEARKLKWRDVAPYILDLPAAPQRADDEPGWRVLVENCVSAAHLLNEWELRFCGELRDFPFLSVKQRARLNIIAAKIRIGARS